MAIFGDFLGLVLSAQHVSDLHLKFALKGHTMWRSMVDIPSATAEIRRGKKEERRKKETTGQNIMACPIM